MRRCEDDATAGETRREDDKALDDLPGLVTPTSTAPSTPAKSAAGSRPGSSAPSPSPASPQQYASFPTEALGQERVGLDELSAEQRASLAHVRTLYVEAGGVLDELWEPFCLRFLVQHKWKFGKPLLSQISSTAKWRKASGANDIRAYLLSGERTFAMCPHVLTALAYVWFLPCHSRSLRGDLVSFLALGSIAFPHWFKHMTDAEYWAYNVAVMEFQGLRNDQLSRETRTLVPLIAH